MDNLQSLHASCVSVNGRGVLITGASGTGKSSLAIELLLLGASFVSDDIVLLERVNDTLVTHAPPDGAGRIELRGIGIKRVNDAHRLNKTTIELVVDLDRAPATRMPEPQFCELLGLSIVCIHGKRLHNLGNYIYLFLNKTLKDS